MRSSRLALCRFACRLGGCRLSAASLSLAASATTTMTAIACNPSVAFPAARPTAAVLYTPAMFFGAALSFGRGAGLAAALLAAFVPATAVRSPASRLRDARGFALRVGLRPAAERRSGGAFGLARRFRATRAPVTAAVPQQGRQQARQPARIALAGCGGRSCRQEQYRAADRDGRRDPESFAPDP